ncbi:MAG: acyl carrier protein [Kiritimatiellia bacterium]
MQELYTKLADILEVDEVKPQDVLRNFESWDSLAALSIIATANAMFGVTLSGEELRQIKTAGELAIWLESRRKK